MSNILLAFILSILSANPTLDYQINTNLTGNKNRREFKILCHEIKFLTHDLGVPQNEWLTVTKQRSLFVEIVTKMKKSASFDVI